MIKPLWVLRLSLPFFLSGFAQDPEPREVYLYAPQLVIAPNMVTRVNMVNLSGHSAAVEAWFFDGDGTGDGVKSLITLGDGTIGQGSQVQCLLPINSSRVFTLSLLPYDPNQHLWTFYTPPITHRLLLFFLSFPTPPKELYFLCL